MTVKNFDITFDTEVADTAVKEVAKTKTGLPLVKLMGMFERKVKAMKEISARHQVKGSESEANAVAMGTQAKQLNASIDKIRMKGKRPFLDICNEIDEYVRPVQRELEDIEGDLKEMVVAYRRRVKIKQDEAARKARETEEKNKKSELKMPVPATPVADLETPVRTITGGSAHFQEKKKFVLKDITKVPADYLLVDWKKVRKAEKSGIVSIPGFDLVDDFDVQFHR
jgi:hypothetical protein